MTSQRIRAFFIGIFFILSLAPAGAQTNEQNPVSLYISPASGTFTVGNTFTASFYLNTGGKFINAVEARILFPEDKLQVVSPTTGSSFINVWTSQPSYSNTEGTLTFIGAVPSPGINTTAGLISTVTFRVKTVGNALIRFSDKSRVLLNDGEGTDVLSKTSGGVYALMLPPPNGPIVSSATHPDQSSWYSNDTVQLSWDSNQVSEGYSYMLSSTPVDIPDNISEGMRNSVAYTHVSDGVHYFHIKSLRGGVWGGVTHFAVKVDIQPPAEFPIEVSPSARTTNRKPIISFSTTDIASGISHYDLSIIPLNSPRPPAGEVSQNTGSQGFFIEATSPYAPAALEQGKYDVIVRAYDNASNLREISQRISIVSPLFQFTTTDGLTIYGGAFTIPWFAVWILILAALGVASFYARAGLRRHREIHEQLERGILHDPVIQARLKLLQDKQRQYTKALVILLFMTLSFVAGGRQAQAQTGSLIAPPVVTLISKNISNEDLFYVGGQTPFKKASVIIYLQDSATGAVSDFETPVDDKGNWFYSHDKFLPAGNYLMWLQTKVGESLSPPSAQFTLTVSPTAIELGSSRISYELIYLVIAIILFLIVVSQIILAGYHYSQNKRKRAIVTVRIKEAEESIRRGFALLRRDIESELKLIHEAKLRGQLSEAEKAQEDTLLKDLQLISENIGKEIWELESMERSA